MKTCRIRFARCMILIAVSLLFSACTPHLSKQQCESINWYQLGYQDGSQGKYQRNLTKDIQDCAQYKLQVNAPAYRRGWQAGVKAFCTPNTAYNLGVNGATYNNICPASSIKAFASAYRRGLRKFCVPATAYNIGRAGKPMPGFCAPDQVVSFRNAYVAGRRVYLTISDIDSQINELNSQIAGYNNQIAAAQSDIDRLQARLVRNKDRHGKPYSSAKRELLLIQVNQDRQTIGRLHQRINRSLAQIDRLRDRRSHILARSS